MASTTLIGKNFSHFQKAESENSRQRFETFIGNAKHRPLLIALHELMSGKLEIRGPVVLFGSSGTGKTHLLNSFAAAMAKEVCAPFPVLNMERFADLLLTADRTETSSVLLETMLGERALVMDNMHTLQPVRVHEVLSTLLDMFVLSGRPVVLAGTGQPYSWPLGQNLQSRLQAGLLFEVPEPDLDISLHFLAGKLREAAVELTRDELLLLARGCRDLRRLSGIVQRILFQRRVTGETPRGQELLALSTQNDEFSRLDHSIIVALTAKAFGVTQGELLGESRRLPCVRARQTAMFLCRSLLGLSYPAIGALFQGKDHSTVIHAVKKIQQLQKDNNDTNKKVTILTKECQLYRQ